MDQMSEATSVTTMGSLSHLPQRAWRANGLFDVPFVAARELNAARLVAPASRLRYEERFIDQDPSFKSL